MTHGTTEIGLVVIFVVVMLPVYVMIAAWLVGKPRDYRAVGVTFSYMLGVTALTIAGLWVLGTAIALVM